MSNRISEFDCFAYTHSLTLHLYTEARLRLTKTEGLRRKESHISGLVVKTLTRQDEDAGTIPNQRAKLFYYTNFQTCSAKKVQCIQAGSNGDMI